MSSRKSVFLALGLYFPLKPQVASAEARDRMCPSLGPFTGQGIVTLIKRLNPGICFSAPELDFSLFTQKPYS